jgi:signal recognition particle subunit SRP54
MPSDSLSSSLRAVLAKIARSTSVDETLLGEVVRDIQRALLQADVNVELTARLTQRLKARARDEKPPAGANLRDFLVRIIYEEIRAILGEAKPYEVRPKRIMLVGLFGQGKTTQAAKLARFYQKKGVRAALVAADVHRPAAIDQLEQLSRRVNAQFYADRGEKRAERIAQEGRARFPASDVIILDTAGRSALDDELIAEVKRCRQVFEPEETLLVLDGAMGQSAGRSAEAFHRAVGLTGVILTKMDGSAKGGGALSAVAASGAPIVFLGVGEHVEDLEPFDPTRYVSRLLGMGDLHSLLERFETLENKEEAEKAAEHLMSGRFSLKDFYVQLDSLGKMGPFSKLLNLLPGMGAAKVNEQQLEETQGRLRSFRVIMDSMTPAEMLDPTILKGDRIQRIARGSGHKPQEVRAMLKHFEQTRKAAHGIASNRKLRRQMERQLASGELTLPKG